MAVKHRKKHRVQYLPSISGIDKYSREYIERLLRELNERVRLPKGTVLTVTTYRFGRRKYYQLVIKRLSDGAVVEELASFPRSSFSEALEFALILLKRAKK